MIDKTKKQLMDELVKLRQRNAELDERNIEHKQIKERLKSFMDSAPDAFVLYDSELNLIDLNKAALKMIGKRKEELLGKNMLAMAPSIRDTSRYESYMDVLRTGKPFYLDELIPDPKYGNIQVSVRAFKADKGLGLIFTNITERKRAEASLRKSEKRFRELIELLPAMVVETDKQGKIIFMNSAVIDALGYSKEDFEKGIKTSQLVIPRDRRIHNELFARRLGGEDIGSSEYIALRKDGSCFPVLVRSKVIKDDNGNAVGTRASVFDISKRKKAEEELQKAYSLMEIRVEERTKELLEANIQMKEEIKERKRFEESLKEREKELEKQAVILEKKNITLREVIAQIEVEKRKIKDDIMANVRVSIDPILERLRMDNVSNEQLDLLCHYIREFTSSFGSKITKKNMNLTPREIEICNIVKGGLTNKDISRLLNISLETVEGHRKSIRKKLGLTSKKVNLASYLQQL
jgi:PAS domain S-box-containing protein